MSEIKINSLVTLPNSKFSTASNTYRVYKTLGDLCILQHPLSSELFFIRKVSELNNVQATLQDSVEKCLSFAVEHEECLSHTVRADLTAMCYYFIVKKNFTMKQRSDLASICGKIASVILHNNLDAAGKVIMPHTALLDDFHTTLYNNFQKVIKDTSVLKNKSERFAVFNIAGFILAQIGEKQYE